MTKIDLLYLTHQRREFVEATYPALLANTDWSKVANLHLVDDDSTDGTQHYNWLTPPPKPTVTLVSRRSLGGPVAAMNHMLDRTKADVIAKVDSDLLLCPGWLNHMMAVLEENPSIDALGLEPGFAPPLAELAVPRSARPARWIGGQGLIRTRVFKHRRPQMVDRWLGWTSFQRRYVKAAWVSPDLPCFNLDHLPFEPWLSLAETYAQNGWSRRWDKYPPEFEPYWKWWLDAQAVAA